LIEQGESTPHRCYMDRQVRAVQHQNPGV
jgi:hypothetical protein